MNDIPRDIQLEKTGYSSPSKYQMQLLFWLGIEVYLLPLPSTRILSGLNLWQSHTCCRSQYEFICASLLRYLEEAISLESVTRLELGCFHLFFHVDPWPLQGFDANIPCRTECSKVSYSLHLVQLRFSVLIIIYCKKEFLWWVLNKAHCRIV